MACYRKKENPRFRQFSLTDNKKKSLAKTGQSKKH
jgi:hypothetical protein